jgi:multiple sugar transport system permease protein
MFITETDKAMDRRFMPLHIRIAVYAALILFGLIFSLPFIWLMTTSFKMPEFILVAPPQWVPNPITMENYEKGLSSIPFLLYLRNTLVICVTCVVGVILSSSLVAYGLSRIEWRGRDVLFIVIIATMMLPYQVIMVPMFAIFTWLGWIDTFLPLTVPAFLGNAFFIFLLRQFFMGIPNDLTDAAKLDGCSEFGVYRRIMIPLSVPALATVGLFTFMNTWNDYLGPLIYIFDEQKYTLSLGLAMFLGQYGSYWGRLMAVSTVVTVPIVVLFFLTQRTFIQGITLTGMKQ